MPINSKRDYSVLIVGPDLTLEGGVANIYRSLKWDAGDRVKYLSVTPGKHNAGMFFIWGMLLKYVRCVRNAQIIQINPSLDFRSVVRDGTLLLIAKVMRKRTIVFFHGWDDNFANKLKNVKLSGWMFAQVFSNTDIFCVLSPLFTKKLTSLRVRVHKVFAIPTVADDSYIGKNAPEKKTTGPIHILFLSRFDENKGVSIVLRAFELLQERSPGHFRLTLAGNGPLFQDYAEKFLRNPNPDITLPGFVDGEGKHKLLESANVLLLPSRSEGLPCAILEAMLYGLVIISRPIGGIPDWVKSPQNGWLLESLEPGEYANVLETLSKNRQLLEQIGRNNRALAERHFTPARIKQRMMMIHKAAL